MILADEIPLIRRLVPLLLAVIVAVATVELIRRRKLREEYAMLWIVASIAMLVFAVFPSILFRLQEALSVNYLTIVLLALILFLSLITMHFAVVISRQAEQIRQLAQHQAMMRLALAQFAEQRDREVEPLAEGEQGEEDDFEPDTIRAPATRALRREPDPSLC